jgi:hypothetical protein
VLQGEKCFETYDIPVYDDLEMLKSLGPCRRGSASGEKDRMRKAAIPDFKREIIDSSVPAILKMLPAAIIDYIPANISLLSTWTALTSNWLSMPATVQVCRKLLEQRHYIQARASQSLIQSMISGTSIARDIDL